jgi:hypothetical protein
MRKSTKIFSICTATVALTACGDQNIRRYYAHFPASQTEAGSVTVSVVSVEHWYDVVGTLSPNFQLTGDQALGKSLPVTAALQEKLLSSLIGGVSVALPTAVQTSTSELVKAADQADAAETSSVKRTETSGEPPTLGGVSETRKAADLPGFDSFKDLLTEGIETNPLLQYQTAVALFQEVKLLNRYVEKAAGRHGFIPYLVRLQIGVTPYAYRQPYDVYARIGFFNGASPKTACQEKKPYENCEDLAGHMPEIVPLVVTDDIELSRQSRAAQAVRQLQAALSGTVQGVGLAGQLQTLNDQLQANAGSGLNSVSTVTRLANNTIQARFGAVIDPTIQGCTLRLDFGCRGIDRSMVNRNYSVSLLLLVPRPLAELPEHGAVRIMARTDMRRITDGSTFPQQTDMVVERFKNTLRTYDSFIGNKSNDNRWDLATVTDLLAGVLDGDQTLFCEKVDPTAGLCRPEANGKPNPAMQALWTDLAQLAAAFDVHTASIDLPIYAPPALPKQQLVVVQDDHASGKATVQLEAGKGLLPTQLSGRLDIVTKLPLAGTRVSANTYPLLAEKVTVAEGGRDVTLTFPSPGKLGFLAGNIERIGVSLTYEGDPRYDEGNGSTVDRMSSARSITPLSPASSECERPVYKSGNSPKFGNSPYRCEYFGIYRPISVGDGAATFSVDALVNRIPLKQGETEGEAKLTVQFKKLPLGPDKVTLKIGNAELLNADGEGVASDRNKNEVTITGAAGVTRRAVLRLGALADSEIVTIVSAGSRGNVEVAGPKDALRLTAKAAAGQAARSASAASGN